MKITRVHARQILDSRGNPTVEADVVLEDGKLGRAAVPSGASTGTNEALELRDQDPRQFGGKGVLNAVNNINTTIAKAVVGKDAAAQATIDQTLIDLDGTPNKGKLGANAILAVSLACAQAAAAAQEKPLFQYLQQLWGTSRPLLLPVPQLNIINGGAHTQWQTTDIQEFMIMPVGAKSFSQVLQMGAEIFHALAKVLKKAGYGTTVGDEGGYAPPVKAGNAEALALISQAVQQAGYTVGRDVVYALDVAASEFYREGKYHLQLENKVLTTEEMITWLVELVEEYPIASIEDGLAESDWSGWQKLCSRLGNKIQLVGDDLLVTNTTLLKRAINEKAANAILIKLNQIGTLTETMAAVRMADEAGWHSIISHRSGETEDTFIAHLAVALAGGQIKTGSLSRSERVAKYNELLRIEELLGDKARFATAALK